TLFRSIECGKARIDFRLAIVSVVKGCFILKSRLLVLFPFLIQLSQSVARPECIDIYLESCLQGFECAGNVLRGEIVITKSPVLMAEREGLCRDVPLHPDRPIDE